MEWISIKDKLPKDFDDKMCEYDFVLVCNDMGIGIARYLEGTWEFIESKLGTSDCGHTFVFESDSITHWMKLPFIARWNGNEEVKRS